MSIQLSQKPTFQHLQEAQNNCYERNFDKAVVNAKQGLDLFINAKNKDVLINRYIHASLLVTRSFAQIRLGNYDKATEDLKEIKPLLKNPYILQEKELLLQILVFKAEIAFLKRDSKFFKYIEKARSSEQISRSPYITRDIYTLLAVSHTSVPAEARQFTEKAIPFLEEAMNIGSTTTNYVFTINTALCEERAAHSS